MSGSSHLTVPENKRDPREIELKLEYDPADLARLYAHPLLGGTASTKKTVRSTYYDTPDLVLRKAGVSLRVREADGRFVQTIKSPNGHAGLFNRSEWKHEVTDGDIDLIAARDTALEPLLNVRVRNALQPVLRHASNESSIRSKGTGRKSRWHSIEVRSMPADARLRSTNLNSS
jgi:CYTH domain